VGWVSTPFVDWRGVAWGWLLGVLDSLCSHNAALWNCKRLLEIVGDFQKV